MIIGYLAIGLLAAFISAFVTLAWGFGLWAILGAYILGGCVGTVIAACAGYLHRLGRPSQSLQALKHASPLA